MLSHFLRAATGNSENPITFVNSASNFSTTSVSSLTITKPSGLQVDDLMVAFLSNNDQPVTFTAPSGWTEVLDADSRGLFWKVATSADVSASNFTWTVSNDGDMYGIILAYRYAVFDVCGTLGALTATNPSGPSINVSSNNSLLFVVASNRGSVPTYTTPSGYTIRWSYLSNPDGPSSVGYFKSVNAGATGNVTVTVSTQARVFLFSIKPN
jgi:hypothetical protein